MYARCLEGDIRDANYGRIAESSGVKRRQKKSPGREGIGREFFKVLWEDIAGDMRKLFTQTLRDRQLSERQKHGVIICIPKNARLHKPEDYNPITLLNTDYKILAKLIAAYMRPILVELIHPSQYCGVPETRSSTQWPQYGMPLPTRRRLGSHYL